MSDCKHEKRTDYVLKHPRYVSYCQHCDADFTHFELETLERAEKAEAKIEEMQKILSEFIYEDQDDGSLKFSIWINELKYDFLTGKTAPYKENE